MTSLAHPSDGIFILFNLTHLWISPHHISRPMPCKHLQKLYLHLCAENSQPCSALLQKFTSLHLPPCWPRCFSRPLYPSLNVLQAEHCKRCANVSETHLSARLSTSSLWQCWGRWNSTGHAWALGEAGCPQQQPSSMVSCHTRHRMLAEWVWSRTWSPCGDQGRGTTGGSSRTPHLASTTGEIQYICSSHLIVFLAWVTNNCFFLFWILPSWKFFMPGLKHNLVESKIIGSCIICFTWNRNRAVYLPRAWY